MDAPLWCGYPPGAEIQELSRETLAIQARGTGEGTMKNIKMSLAVLGAFSALGVSISGSAAALGYFSAPTKSANTSVALEQPRADLDKAVTSLVLTQKDWTTPLLQAEVGKLAAADREALTSRVFNQDFILTLDRAQKARAYNLVRVLLVSVDGR